MATVPDANRQYAANPADVPRGTLVSSSSMPSIGWTAPGHFGTGPGRTTGVTSRTGSCLSASAGRRWA
jgi:hypothetical protein